MAWLPAVCEKESNTNDIGLDWTGTHIYMASMAGMYVYHSDLVQCIQCVVYPPLATWLQGQCSTN